MIGLLCIFFNFLASTVCLLSFVPIAVHEWVANGCERYTPEGHKWREETIWHAKETEASMADTVIMPCPWNGVSEPQVERKPQITERLDEGRPCYERDWNANVPIPLEFDSTWDGSLASIDWA